MAKNSREVLKYLTDYARMAGAGKGSAIKLPFGDAKNIITELEQLQAKIEAQAKQIKGLEKTNNEFADGIETVNAACVKKTRLLQAQIKKLEGEKKRLEEPDVNLKTALAEFGRIEHLFEIKKPKQGQLVEMERRLNNLLWHLQALQKGEAE